MSARIEFHWLWSEVYKGLEITFGDTNVARPRFVFLGWTTRFYKRRGW